MRYLFQKVLWFYNWKWTDLNILLFCDKVFTFNRIFFMAYRLPSNLFSHNTTCPKPPSPATIRLSYWRHIQQMKYGIKIEIKEIFLIIMLMNNSYRKTTSKRKDRRVMHFPRDENNSMDWLASPLLKTCHFESKHLIKYIWTRIMVIWQWV